MGARPVEQPEMDCGLVVEDGRVVELGSHDELLDANALYREIVEKGLPDAVFLTRKPREPETAGL